MCVFCDVTGKEEFSVEDNAVLEQLIQGHMLQAEVVGHEESDCIPYVQLYMVNGNQVTITQCMASLFFCCLECAVSCLYNV